VHPKFKQRHYLINQEVTMTGDKNNARAHALTRRDFIAAAALLGTAGTTLRLEAAPAVGGIDHVNIRVPDVQRSADFYTKLFGVDVARAPNAKAQTANPASPSGVLWFIRLGRSFLAISPVPAGGGPGLDHFSFGIAGFNGEAVKSQLAGLNQQWPDSPSNNLWLKDPVGRVIQLNAPADPSRVPGAGVGAVPVEPPGGVKRQPAFQPVRITLLTIAVRQQEPSATYYRKLFGAENEQPQKGTFRVGSAAFVLGPASGGDYFRVGIAGFDAATAVAKLKNLGVKADVTPDKSTVSFRDIDGIRVQIGGDS
jgi:catechol 2,3-dioxygenase-like lactoylglutathione lyase family enzyme